MDFSAWNWATSFRVHEAACLIAGVMPISKRQPTSEELPPQARPILVKLMAAYVEWILQKKNPDRPKSIFLEGYLNDDGTPPEINSLAELPGSLVSREAINRFLSEIEGELGLKSACDFGPIRKTADPLSMDGQRLIQATPTPVEADSASNASVWAVQKPKRYAGYTAPLYRLLSEINCTGRPVPTARDVVEAWRITPPAEIAQVLVDGFDYYDSRGETKAASLDAIRKAIERMTDAR